MRKVVKFIFLFSLMVTLAFPFIYPVQAATIFSDTFSGDLSSWSYTSGSWVIESGELSQDDEVIGWTSIVAGEESWTNYAVEAKVKLLTGGDSYAGILFRYTGGSGYWFGLRYATQWVQLERWSKAPISSASFSHILNQWYVLKVEVSGDTIKGYVDGDLKITASIGNAYPNGKIGFSTCLAHAHFDDVVVHNPIEPTLTVTKSATPTDIYLAGSGLIPEYTTITISVTGFGGVAAAERLPIDVVYALDSSGSMSWNDPTNLRLQAAKDFTDLLDSAKDQAGVVSWDSNIDFTQPLTDDFTLVKNQIDNVDSSGGTDLDIGLAEAIAVLDANTRVGSSVEVIIFLSNGAGGYTPYGGGGPVDDAVAKGYTVYTIGLSMTPGSTEENNLIDIADATGGTYYPSPTAENLQNIFDDIFQAVIISTAPTDVDVVEVTQDYIVDEGSFSIAPDSIVENLDGTTTMTWLDVGDNPAVGDGADPLDATETFTVSFQAKCNVVGDTLPVQVEGSAVVNFIGPLGDPISSVDIPQDYINVLPPDFFVIPEFPLGTILGLLAMLGALGVYKSKRIHIHL